MLFCMQKSQMDEIFAALHAPPGHIVSTALFLVTVISVTVASMGRV